MSQYIASIFGLTEADFRAAITPVANAVLARNSGNTATTWTTTPTLTGTNFTGVPVAGITGITTVGGAFVALANPGAITFPRLNADNTVTALSAADFRTAIGAGTGGGDALTTNPLSQFAATTSLQLKGVISDETGSGALVFATSPTFVAPVLGAATATSINGLAVSTTAGAALAIENGRTLTANNTLTLTATDGSTLAIGSGGTLGTAAFTAASAYQPIDATLTALAALTIAANSLTIGTGADAFLQTTFAANTFPARASTGNLEAKTVTDVALTLLTQTSQANMRTTGLGLGGAAVVNTGTSGATIPLLNTYVTRSEPFAITKSIDSGEYSEFPSIVITNTATGGSLSFSGIKLVAGNGVVVGEQFADGTGIFNSGTPIYLFRVSTNHPLAFATNNAERLRITAAGDVAIGVSAAAAGTKLTVDGPIGPKNYTVVTLPTAGTARRIAYASDGRKNGEGGGSGTGVLVFDDGAAWRACDTGATVAA